MVYNMDGSYRLVEDDEDCCSDDIVEMEGKTRRECGPGPRWAMKDNTSDYGWSSNCTQEEGNINPRALECKHQCTQDPELYPGKCTRLATVTVQCSSLNQTECGSKS